MDDLFDRRTRLDELREQCQKYSDEHPLVWKLFVRFTFDRINRGFEHYSANAIFERIRWETDQAQVDPKKRFKICNNYRPFYARRFMKMYPQHEGFFRVRTQTSANEPPTGQDEPAPEDLR